VGDAAKYEINKTLRGSLLSITAPTQRGVDALRNIKGIENRFDFDSVTKALRGGLRIPRKDIASGATRPEAPTEAGIVKPEVKPPKGRLEQIRLAREYDQGKRELWELTMAERGMTEIGELAVTKNVPNLSELDKQHRKSVEDAVKKGLQVREEVLAEFPARRAPNDTKPVNKEAADLKQKLATFQKEKDINPLAPDAIKHIEKKIKLIEDAEKGKVREDAPEGVLELVAKKAKIDAKLKAALAKGSKADATEIMNLQIDRSSLTEEIGKAKLGKPRTGDQVTLRTTTKGGKKVVKKPIDDPAMRGKIELQNIFEGVKDQVVGQALPSVPEFDPHMKAMGVGQAKRDHDIDWSLITAPEHTRIRKETVEDASVSYQPDYKGPKQTKDIYTLEIDLPFVNGTYEVKLPDRVTMQAGGEMAKGANDNLFFKQFSKAKVAQAFRGPSKPGLTGGGGKRTAEDAPGFTAPARKSLIQQDNKALNKSLKGWQKRLKQYEAYKEPTGDIQRSIGELKEAIKIAEDLVKVQKEADRLGGAVVGMDFIPGTTAFFNAMRRWKRSKLPISDRKKMDSLVRRSNKLHNEWVAEGRVDREMEGRLGKLSDEIVALENKVANQIPSETEMVKINQDIKWPSRTTDLRRTHKKERVLNR
jgi:hypothetical protein